MHAKPHFAHLLLALALPFLILTAPSTAQSPDQYPIAAVTNGNIWLYDLTGRGLKVSNGQGFHDPIWSPDGAVLAFVGPSTEGNTTSIYITNFTGYPPVELIHG